MNNKNQLSLRGTVLALGAGICWGFSGNIGQLLNINYSLDVGFITSLRMIICGIILITVGAIKKDKNIINVWKTKRSAIRLVLFSIFGLMISSFSYLKAISFSNAGTATALQYTGEVFILIFSCFAARRLPFKSELLALALAMLAIFFISTHGDINSLALSEKALFWGMISAFTLMLYTVMPGKLIKKYSSIAVTGNAVLIGGIVLALIIRIWQIPVNMDFTAVIYLFIMASVGTAVAYTAFLQATTDIGPVKAGLLSSIETVSAPFFAIIMLKVKFSRFDYFGLICIILMVLLFALPGIKKNSTLKID